MLSCKKFVWISLILVAFFSGLSLWKIQPNISGDGLEYTLMTQAFIGHGSPNITPDDYREVQSYKGDVGTNIPAVAAYYSLSSSPPYFRDPHGQYYSYHFWLYSLFVVPLFFLTKLFGLATPWAFVATNLVFALAASYAICACRDVGREQRLLLLSLYWSCGTIPYIRWTHPEVFSASLLAISMVMALRRRYVLAAIAAAMVAQQNPPVLLLVVILFFIDFYINFRQSGAIFPPISKVIGWSTCIAVASMSIIFFFIHFRTGNLIAHSGSASVDLISVGRLLSFYFDLNQGLIVLLWPLLLIVPSLVVYGFLRGSLKVQHFSLAGALLCASIVLALSAISTTNFNSGASFVMRYAYWASVPLLFSVAVLCADGVGSRVIACVGVVIFSIVNLFYYTGEWRNALSYTPFSEKIMGMFPGLYNPVPEIFVERGLHFEQLMNDKAIFYYAKNGVARKILLNGSSSDVSRFKCLNGDHASNYVSSISPVEQGWIYFNLRSGCSVPHEQSGTYEAPLEVGPGDTLSFRDVGTGRLYLGSGWSAPESWGVWSDAREASIILPLKNNDIREISFNVGALVNGQRKEQMVNVSVNGVNSASVLLNEPANNVFSIRIPADVLRDMPNSGLLKLKFEFHDPVSPRALGISGDDRTLAMGLISLAIK
ncbi:hypothetical protein [Burkholderia multivorans]|uniref:hypothetical protein n=1 Tax=Burkholderia multivorans TaxID=87883 RepID=UPI0011B2542C|nr:hypothetical protein [Burkholderia multivorans]